MRCIMNESANMTDVINATDDDDLFQMIDCLLTKPVDERLTGEEVIRHKFYE